MASLQQSSHHTRPPVGGPDALTWARRPVVGLRPGEIVRLPPLRIQRRARIATVDHLPDGRVAVIVQWQLLSGVPLTGKPESYMTFEGGDEVLVAVAEPPQSS